MNSNILGTATRSAVALLLIALGAPELSYADACPTITISPATLPSDNLGESTPAWNVTGSMTIPRVNHTATVLNDGRVLVTGGYSNVQPIPVVDRYVSSAEIYDPATGTWRSTAPMSAKRAHHTATLLQDGKVLVAGGFNLDANNEHDHYLASAELFDPATGSWTPTNPLIEGCAFSAATLLSDGRVMVAGGEVFNGVPPHSGYFPISDIQVYDPSSGTWQFWSSLTRPQRDIGAVLMPNGNVFFAGGRWSPTFADMYDPIARTRAEVATPGALFQILNLLPNGKVLATGGGAEVYDSTTDTWTETGPMVGTHVDHQATLLPSGKVLVSGGAWQFQRNTAELYDPESNNWRPTGPMTFARSFHRQVLLHDGSVLVCGGGDATAEVYPTADLSASSGVPPYTFSVTAGSIPAGLTLHGNGTWTGIPCALGTNLFTVTATDANGCTGTATYSVVVNPYRPPAGVYRPSVAIVGPLPNKVFNSPAITVSGTAHINQNPNVGNDGLVLYSLNGGDQHGVTTPLGQNFITWTAPITLQPGWNTFSVQAFDYIGDASLISTRMFFFGNSADVVGTCNGLFYETNGMGEPLIKEQSAGGVFNLNVQLNRTYSGGLFLAGAKYPLKGQFDPLGNSTVSIARGVVLPPVNVAMYLDWTGATKQITGTVSCPSEGWSAPLLADFGIYNINNQHALARYTMAIAPAADAPASSPGGFGYGLVSINALGKVTLSGALAESGAINQTVPISKDGRWPVYVDLYNHQGLLEGWLDFSSGAPAGQLTWIKPANPSGVALTTYLGGFTNTVAVFGSVYAPSMPAMTVAVGTLQITDGSGLNLPLTYNAQFSGNNLLQKTSNTPTNALQGSVITATGLFNVHFKPTNIKGLRNGVGVVLQSSNAAYGAFIGNNDGTGKTNTGAIYLR